MSADHKTEDPPSAKRDSRERIRRAAIDLFQRKGYDATGIRELTDAAGIGVGALYHHIGSKEELLFDISLELLHAATAEAEQIVSTTTGPEQQLRALARHLVVHRATRDDAWSVVLREDRALTPDHRASVNEARDTYEAIWSTVLTNGASSKGWQPLDAVDLRGLLGMFLSTARWLDRDGRRSPAEVADRYVDILLGGFGPAPAAADLVSTQPSDLPQPPKAGSRSGPLAGVKVVEFAGIGPAPMAAMVLADLGATVIRIDRRQPSELGIPRPLRYSYSMRSRPAITLDLKDPAGIDAALTLIGEADALIEGFRPGVMERLGLGPADALRINPGLVYGRVTGWGQTGPLAQTAGHDINYLAVTGVLDAIGQHGGPPTVPLNLVGDYAGGAMYLAVGLLAALIEARQSGRGQVIDAAIVDGVAHLASVIVGLVEAGDWDGERGTNTLDGGAFYYGVYECSDGRWASVGPIEPKFLAELVNRLDLTDLMPSDDDPNFHQIARQLLASTFLTKPLDVWTEMLANSDACFAPVLSFDEAFRFPHLTERGTYIEIDGTIQPAPAPRFSRTAPSAPTAPSKNDHDIDAVLARWLTIDQITRLRTSGAIK